MAKTTLLIEGSFRELIEELVDYVDTTKKNASQTEEAPATLRNEVQPLVEKYAQAEETNEQEQIEEARENILEAVVQPASVVLNHAPERGTWETLRECLIVYTDEDLEQARVQAD
jgi:translation initiation factor 3 subunit M